MTSRPPTVHAAPSPPMIEPKLQYAPGGHDDHAAHEARFADSFKRDYPIAWWATLLGPFVVTGTMLAMLAVTRGVDFVAKLLATSAVTFFGLGRFVILFGSDAPKTDLAGLEAFEKDAGQFNFLTRGELFTMVSWMDAFVAILLVFHAGFIFKLPKIGPKLLALREEGEFFMSVQPWMRRFAFLGLVAFVVIPIAATGSIGGSILGRMLGMSRLATISAIAVGTLLGNSVMLLAGKALSKIPFFDPHNPLSLLAGVVVIAGLIVFLNLHYKRLKRRWRDDARFPRH